MRRVLKRTIYLSILFVAFVPCKAQLGFQPFKHVGIGVEVGTTGVGFEVATTIHSMLNVRGGFAFLPFSYTTDFDVEYNEAKLQKFIEKNGSQVAGFNLNTMDASADLKAKSGLYNGKILLDFHPIPTSGFHVTAGLYFGKERIVEMEGYSETLEAFYQVNSIIDQHPEWDIEKFKTGVVVGDYTVGADQSGKIDAGIKINKVKPYAGIGFGRAIPKRRVGFQFDLGCMFHGKPTVISKNADVADLINDELDSNGFVDIMNKITVYPVLSFKLTGRIL